MAGEQQDEVAALKQQVAELKASFAQAAAERDALAKQLKESASRPPAWDVSKTDEVEKLQERLKQLKQEQTAANASREAAWKQLKDAVGEIAKIVNQNDLSSLSVRNSLSASSPIKQDAAAADQDLGRKGDAGSKKEA